MPLALGFYTEVYGEVTEIHGEFTVGEGGKKGVQLHSYQSIKAYNKKITLSLVEVSQSDALSLPNMNLSNMIHGGFIVGEEGRKGAQRTWFGCVFDAFSTRLTWNGFTILRS